IAFGIFHIDSLSNRIAGFTRTISRRVRLQADLLEIRINAAMIPRPLMTTPNRNVEAGPTRVQSCPPTRLANNPDSPTVAEYQPTPPALRSAGTKSVASAFPTARYAASKTP